MTNKNKTFLFKQVRIGRINFIAMTMPLVDKIAFDVV